METPTIAPMPPTPPPTLDEIARNQIRKWIASTGTTQTDLSTRIGRNQAWMSRYLAGEFDADLTTLSQIAHVFGHTLAALLEVPADPDEGTLLTAYRALRPEARALLRQIALEWSRGRGRRGKSRP